MVVGCCAVGAWAVAVGACGAVVGFSCVGAVGCADPESQAPTRSARAINMDVQSNLIFIKTFFSYPVFGRIAALFSGARFVPMWRGQGSPNPPAFVILSVAKNH